MNQNVYNSVRLKKEALGRILFHFSSRKKYKSLASYLHIQCHAVMNESRQKLLLVLVII